MSSPTFPAHVVDPLLWLEGLLSGTCVTGVERPVGRDSLLLRFPTGVALVLHIGENEPSEDQKDLVRELEREIDELEVVIRSLRSENDSLEETAHDLADRLAAMERV